MLYLKVCEFLYLNVNLHRVNCSGKQVDMFLGSSLHFISLLAKNVISAFQILTIIRFSAYFLPKTAPAFCIIGTNLPSARARRVSEPPPTHFPPTNTCGTVADEVEERGDNVSVNPCVYVPGMSYTYQNQITFSRCFERPHFSAPHTGPTQPLPIGRPLIRPHPFLVWHRVSSFSKTP